MIDVAVQMLYGDRAKYALLISGVCFSSILMAQGLAMFFGILSFSYATLDNIRAPIWVVDQRWSKSPTINPSRTRTPIVFVPSRALLGQLPFTAGRPRLGFWDLARPSRSL